MLCLSLLSVLAGITGRRESRKVTAKDLTQLSLISSTSQALPEAPDSTMSIPDLTKLSLTSNGRASFSAPQAECITSAVSP